MNAIQLADRAIAGLINAEDMSNRYGRQRKSRQRVIRELRDSLRRIGYTEDMIHQVVRDVYDMVALVTNEE